ncbi:MAG TPA: M48 family metallopeptidase [Gemmatales bacterium]|nr:M48 family metallopeptidase [Gemmatales bacterium]
MGLIGGGLAAVWALISYYAGSKMILGMTGAKPISHYDDPELFNVVEEMAIAAGVPMPQVFLIEDMAPNAFATGRDPAHAAVAITRGLRLKLNREELQGVMAHEMAHVRNFDIRLMMLLAVMIGLIVMLAEVFRQMLRWGHFAGGRRGGRGSSSEKGGGAIVLVIVVVALILSIVAPILARLIQLAVSRQREYLADATAVQLTRNPLGLASALRKIDSDPEELHVACEGTAHLYIASPLKKLKKKDSSVFSSHPPIGERVQRLEALARAG